MSNQVIQQIILNQVKYFETVQFVKFVKEGVIVQYNNQQYLVTPQIAHKLYTTTIMDGPSAVKYRKSKSQYAVLY